MKSILAIVAGSLFVFVVMLVLQLAHIYISVGYKMLASDYPFLNDIAGSFKYIVGIPIFMAVLFAGGYITANTANIHVRIRILLHCLLVGLITVGVMMYSALENANLTLAGVLVTVLAVTASSAGGFYWLRREVSQKREN